MSKAASLPYHLRPNKAVDRELFLSLLSRLASTLKLESYRYVGLGGPFLEDFRLLHARLGIVDLVCVESEEHVHDRQVFNRPVASIDCVCDTLENYIDSNDLEKPSIIWFDYTEPATITEQIERFSRTILTVPKNSILRITVNANPSSLGKPEDLATNLATWRLDRFHERMGSLFPTGLKPSDMEQKRYGRSLLKALHLAVEREVLNVHDRKAVWALATHYADGQPMATATVIVCDVHDSNISRLVEEWEFSSTPKEPRLLDMPVLSSLERLTMEGSYNARKALGFELPKSDLGEDPFESFKRFYRVLPHFSRVEL